MDSKKQRRLQCSFGHFQRFIAEYPHRIVAQGSPSAFRDRTLSAPVITSGRRVRHPRHKVPAQAAVPESH
jgi:hypothetical protein